MVLSDIAAVGYVSTADQGWPHLPGVVLLAAVFGQMALLAAWFTFVRLNIVLRLLSALAGVLGLALIAAGATTDFEGLPLWFSLQLWSFVSFAVPMGMAKLARCDIRWEGQSAKAHFRTTWQFSTWGLLSATTAVAIALGAARQIEMPFIAVGEAIAFFGCIAATGLLVFAVAMGIRNPAAAVMVTLPLVIFAGPLTGIVIGQTGLPPDETIGLWIIFGLAFSTMIAVSVLVVRVAGLRLYRRAKGCGAAVEPCVSKSPAAWTAEAEAADGAFGVVEKQNG